MKKKMAVCLVGLLLAQVPVLAIDEVTRSDSYEIPRIYGGLTKKEVFSQGNIVEEAVNASVNIDVVTQDELQSQGTPVLSAVLNQLGSVTTQNSNGSLGNVTTLRIRGTDRVRVNIDGVGFNNIKGTASTFEVQNIFTDDIERIEVVKGAQGTIGGTSASGGLVSLTTRRGEGKPQVELASDFGNLGTFRERAAFMGSNGKQDYYMALNWLKTDGGAKTKRLGRVKNDDYNNLGVVANFGTKLLDDKAELRNVFRMSSARKDLGIGYGYDAFWNPITIQDPNNYSRTNDIVDTISFKHAPTNWYDYEAKFGVHNENYKYWDVNDITNIKNKANSSQYNSTGLVFNTQHNLKYKKLNTLSLGYNLEPGFLNAVSDGFRASEVQNSVYVNDTINIKDKLFIRGGTRILHSNRFGTYITPNASASLVLPTFKISGAKTKFRGSYGESVNTPTLYQRFATADYGWFKQLANPNLKAERMRGWDAAIEQSFFDDKLSFEFGYFQNKYRNYVGYEYNAWWTEGWYTNVDSAKINGWEGKVTFAPNDKFKVVANYTYTGTKDKATGTELPASPKNRINTTLYFRPHERVDLWAGVSAYSSRTIATGNNTRLSGFVDASLGASVRLFSIKNMHFYLKGQFYNLLNQNMAMYKGSGDTFYAPGINFRLGLFAKYDPNLKEKL